MTTEPEDLEETEEPEELETAQRKRQMALHTATIQKYLMMLWKLS